MAAILHEKKFPSLRKIQFTDLNHSPGGKEYLTQSYQEILEPIYGSQQVFLEKIFCAEDRFCELLQENDQYVGILVCKNSLVDEFERFGITQCFEIKSLFLTDAEQNSGRGLGSILLLHALHHAHSQKAKYLCVKVNSKKIDSIKFFLKNHFEQFYKSKKSDSQELYFAYRL